MTAGDQRWVLAVDVRPGTSGARTATADDDGVHVHPIHGGGLEEVARAEAAARARVAPLAVVVVHPGTWQDDAAGRAADDVGTALGRVLGEDAVEWPWPVPLNALEASAWRALEYGLLPPHARVAVVDPVTSEAGAVDREYGRLAAVGTPQVLTGPGGDEELVALAGRVLDDAPAGPPFAGVVLAGADRTGGGALAAVVARRTGRPALVPGDPATVALLGAASLGWAAATASAGAPPVPRPRPSAARQGEDGPGGGARTARGDAPSAGAAPGGPVGGSRKPAALPAGEAARRLPRWVRWVVPLAALVLVAAVAGLLVHRERAAPSPFTYTCPNGEVVAFRYECDRLAPSAPSAP